MIAQLKAYGWQIAALVLAAGLLWQTQQRHAAELDAAEARTDLATERGQHERSARAQADQFRALEGTHRDEIIQTIAGASAAAAAAGADAVRARAARDELQRDLADYITAHRVAAQARAAAGNCTPDPAPIDLLADLQRRADDRAGELAAVADQARTRGAACERIYDSAHAMSQAAQQQGQ